jgi:hypothetical protein
MNVDVRAESIESSASVNLVEPLVSAQVKIVGNHIMPTVRFCSNTTPISINGHSISAVAPDFSGVNKATLIKA